MANTAGAPHAMRWVTAHWSRCSRRLRQVLSEPTVDRPQQRAHEPRGSLPQRFGEVVLGVVFGFELVDLVAPGNPTRTALTCEQLDIGAVDEALDSLILFVGLLRMLAPRRNDQL